MRIDDLSFATHQATKTTVNKRPAFIMQDGTQKNDVDEDEKKVVVTGRRKLCTLSHSRRQKVRAKAVLYADMYSLRCVCLC
jgi:hypothetical protein